MSDIVVWLSGAEMIARHRFRLANDGNCAEVDSAGLSEEIDTALSNLRAELAKRDEWVMHWQTKCQATRSEELKAITRADAAEASALTAEAKAEGLAKALEELPTAIMALDWKARKDWTVEDQANRHGELQEMIAAAIRSRAQESETGARG